ncbi:MAG: hypothetical protein HXO16_06870 [Prevotella salivae]|nr:hypothetical protein [Segatella salivae]
MTRRFASNLFVICYGVLKETITPMAWIHFCSTMLNVNLLEKGTTLTALFPTQHVHSQGSLHYRLTTLGYQRYNAYSVDSHIP